jgi:hypothetical protein
MNLLSVTISDEKQYAKQIYSITAVYYVNIGQKNCRHRKEETVTAKQTRRKSEKKALAKRWVSCLHLPI